MKHKIEWTEKTWNPSAGCTKTSSGCENCYAEVMANRLQAMNVKGYENGFEFNIVPDRLNDPLKRKKPTVYFVNSMSDIFHKEMPLDYLDEIFDIIEKTPQHTYQRIDKLRNLKASVLFLSVEPLLEDLGKINLKNINWVIVGGESGHKARPMYETWVLNVKEQCKASNVAFFFKQWGTWGADKVKRNKKDNGKVLEGKVWQEYPEFIKKQYVIQG